MRVLAIDPGSKNIGLALSDPSGTIANPLMVIKHKSRELDTDKIVEIIQSNEVKFVVIGCSYDENGLPTFEGRRAQRLSNNLSAKTDIPVQLWNEDFSTQVARQTRISMGGARKKRKGHLDDIAATVILQDFLDHGFKRIEPS